MSKLVLLFLFGPTLAFQYAHADSPIIKKSLGVEADAQLLASSFEQQKYYGKTWVASKRDERGAEIKDTGLKLTASERTEYLAPTPLLISDNPLIQRVVALITASAKTDLEKIFVIHNFVLWRVSYIMSDAMVANPGSRKALLTSCFITHKTSAFDSDWKACGIDANMPNLGDGYVLMPLYLGIHNCAGYAHLFATLARAAGIPTRIARESKTNNYAGGHFWDQVFFRGQWLVVDATFDDKYDDASDTFDKMMQFDFDYFLISPQVAAQLDSQNHKEYITGDLDGRP